MSATLCATWSLLIQNEYMPAGIVRTAGDVPLGVKRMGAPLKAEPPAGNAKASAPRKATCVINRHGRVMTYRAYCCCSMPSSFVWLGVRRSFTVIPEHWPSRVLPRQNLSSLVVVDVSRDGVT